MQLLEAVPVTSDQIARSIQTQIYFQVMVGICPSLFDYSCIDQLSSLKVACILFIVINLVVLNAHLSLMLFWLHHSDSIVCLLQNGSSTYSVKVIKISKKYEKQC